MKIPMEDYVRDNVGAPVPTLSSGLAHRLLTRSPLHAWWGHPKLNPGWQEAKAEAFDIGTAAHDLIIEGHTDRIVVVDAGDWRTKDAREQRDAARAEGKLPLLARQYEEVKAMLEPAKAAFESDDLMALGKLDPEETFVWADPNTGAWLRCRPDWVTTDRKIIVSYKTTQNAEPGAFTRQMLGLGYEMQAMFEIAGVDAICEVPNRAYVWLVQETAPPHACSLIGLSPAMLDYAAARFDAAVHLWAQCRELNQWPGYPPRVCYPDPPAWALAQQMEMEEAQNA